MALSLGIRFPPVQPPLEIAEHTAEAERAGFESAWVTDTPLIGGLWGDPYVYLALMAQRTEKMKIGVAVTNPFMRLLPAAGAAARTVHDISGGRFILGVGAGGSSAWALGMRKGQLGLMRDFVQSIKPLFREGKTEWKERPFELKPPRDIPIYIAAQGPKTIEAAGEIADGVILQVGANEKTIAWALEHLERGAKKAGRKLSDIFIMMSVHCCAHSDPGKQISRMRHLMATFYLTSTYILDVAGLERVPPPEDLKIYPDLSHAYDMDEASRVASFVPDEAVETLALLGSKERWLEKLRMIQGMGVQHILLRGPDSYNPPFDEIAFCREEIIPELGRL